MSFLVPYDGSSLGKAALIRATEYADALDENVTVVTIIPDDQPYAESKDWYDPTESEPFSVPYVTGKLHKDVTALAPRAVFRSVEVETGIAVSIANRIRDVADEVLPAVVFIGTDNVGEIVESVTSIAGEVAQDAEYDVHVVRHFSPPTVRALPFGEERTRSTNCYFEGFRRLAVATSSMSIPDSRYFSDMNDGFPTRCGVSVTARDPKRQRSRAS